MNAIVNSHKASSLLCRNFITKQLWPALPFKRALTVSVGRPTNTSAFAIARSYATTNKRQPLGRSPSRPSRTLRIPPLAIVLSSLAFVCLGIGLYEHLWSDIQNFPPAVRQPLRKGLYYQNKGEMSLALKYIQEALDVALASPDLLIDKLGTTAPLTGIMIQLGAVQEQMGRTVEAKRTYLMALRHVLGIQGQHTDTAELENTLFNNSNGDKKDLLSHLPPIEQKKAIGLAQKLGDLAFSLKKDEEAEKWYVWSVEHLLKISARPVSEYGDRPEVIFDEEHMPEWLTKTDVGASLEALGGFYASRNKPRLAIHLYMKALNLNGVESCHATVLMNNLAEAYSALGQYEEAKLWGQKGLDLVQNPNTRKANKDGEVCDETCGVLLLNMGMLFEQTQNKERARQFYENAQKHARQYKQIDCLKETHHALKRLELAAKTSDN